MGIASLLIALVSRIRARNSTFRKLLNPIDAVIAIIATAFEITIPVVLLNLIMTVPFIAYSNSAKSDGKGCFAMAFDLFNFHDDDDE